MAKERETLPFRFLFFLTLLLKLPLEVAFFGAHFIKIRR